MSFLGNRRFHLFFTLRPFRGAWGEEQWKPLWLKHCVLRAHVMRRRRGTSLFGKRRFLIFFTPRPFRGASGGEKW
eukprot:770582-Lingulodinium_polyedra.AAC.1